MTTKWNLLILSTLLLLELCHTNIIPTDADYFYNDDDNLYSAGTIKDKRSWFISFERNLAKYKNFYANLLQEDNQEYAVEIQELYNIASQALVESDSRKKEKMLSYSVWLLETTKNLQNFLMIKGLDHI